MPIRELCPLKGLREFDVDGAPGPPDCPCPRPCPLPLPLFLPICLLLLRVLLPLAWCGAPPCHALPCPPRVQRVLPRLLARRLLPTRAQALGGAAAPRHKQARPMAQPHAAGGKLTGPVPTQFASCFPALREIDLRCAAVACNAVTLALR